MGRPSKKSVVAGERLADVVEQLMEAQAAVTMWQSAHVGSNARADKLGQEVEILREEMKAVNTDRVMWYNAYIQSGERAANLDRALERLKIEHRALQKAHDQLEGGNQALGVVIGRLLDRVEQKRAPDLATGG